MDHQTEQIEKWKKEYFRREKWRKLQVISISFCFICLMLCVAGILYCTSQQKVQSTITVDYSRPSYQVSFDPNSDLGPLGILTNSSATGSVTGNNSTVTWNGEYYQFTIGTDSDPYCTIQQQINLTAGHQYVMHVEVRDSASSSGALSTGGSFQVFYAINRAYSEAQSIRFNDSVQTATFSVSTTGTYSIRLDNDYHKEVYIFNFYVREYLPSQQVKLGDTYGTLPTPTKTGYTHAGWKNGSTSVVSSTQNTTVGDHILTAQWTPKTYTITLDMQSGSGGSSEVTATYDAIVPSITPPARNGYDFAGYYSSTGGGGTKYYNASGAGIAAWTTDASATLYAYWAPKTIKITLNKNGGSGGTDTFYYKYGTNTFYSDAACTTQITSITKPTRTGYTFVHYYGDGSCGGDNGERYVAYDSTNFATDLCTDIYKDATLYASWKGNTYTITISYTVPRCGTCNAAGTVTSWVNCSTCGGAGTVAGKVNCNRCDGSGGDYKSCGWCNGSGSTSTRKTCAKTETCSECGGTGQLKDLHGAVAICADCDGSGTVTCSTCNGKGYYYETTTCSHCNGSGETDTWVDCSTCGGSGKVSGQVTCSSCNGSKGSNVNGTCTTCSGNKTNFSGGTQTVTATYGQTLPSFTVKSFTGYTIGVPNYSVSGTTATSSSTYTTAGNATWSATLTPKNYTMTLSGSDGSWSGTATATTTITFGTSVSLKWSNSLSGYDNYSCNISGYTSASGSKDCSVSFVMPAQNISLTGSSSGSNNSCLAYDTPILTSNGWKMVQDITYSDLLVRFNHDTGKIDMAYPSWISQPVKSSRIMQVTFSDGEVIKFAGDHAVFSLDQNKYVTVTDPSKFAVGTRVLKYIAGDCGESDCSLCHCCAGAESCSSWGEAVVTDIKLLDEEVLAYSIITPGTWNCFAGNILTTVPNTIIFQNMYGFKKNLIYASSIRQKVLSGQYDDHLFTEQELKDMGWSDRDIVGFRGREWKILVESGMIDMDFIIENLQKEIVNNSNESLLPNVNAGGNFEFVVTTSVDIASGTFNSANYLYEEYFEYVLPNILDENFVGWRNAADGKIYRAGDIYVVRTGTHFQAIFSQ